MDYTFNDTFESEMNKSFHSDKEDCSRSLLAEFHVGKKTKSFFKDSKPISRFIQEMNSNAKKLSMTNTHYDSPHGLANYLNVSTAYDIAILCSVCVKNIDFNRITRTKSYVCKNRIAAGFQLNKPVQKDYSWLNTNKLLSKGFIGIKTGVTYPAGPCLATYLKSK